MKGRKLLSTVLVSGALLFSSCTIDGLLGFILGDNSVSTSVTYTPEFVTIPVEKANAKRGMGFNHLSQTNINALSGKNISWAYNWGIKPDDVNRSNIGVNGSFIFAPMTWGGVGNEAEIRAYLDTRPNVKYLLGFNEPNLTGEDGGCNMIPSKAAELWPVVEKIAADYNLKLVSPAMQYSGRTLTNGKIYGTPESWINEWISEYKRMWGKEPRWDYLALHCYMAWPSAQLEGYCDKYYDMYGKKIILSEFCAWNDEGAAINEDWQMEKMAQKIEAMDKSNSVEAYAWFMADGNYGKRPWNSFFDSRKALSKVGAVYSTLGCPDSFTYQQGQAVPAVAYVDSSNVTSGGKKYDAPLGFDLSTDPKSYVNIPAMLTRFRNNDWVKYRVNLSKSGEHKVYIRMLSNSVSTFTINGTEYSFGSTDGKWATYEITQSFTKGDNLLKIEGKTSGAGCSIAWICVD